MHALGRHLLAEFFECRADFLDDRARVEKMLVDAAIECGATVVGQIIHQFNPHGISGVVVIAESHLAIHTWPEYHYAAIDVFTCGDTVRPMDALHFMERELDSKNMKFVEMKRGMLSGPQGIDAPGSLSVSEPVIL